MKINKFELENGLRVVHLEEMSSQMIVVNTLYGVGSKHESEEATGIAHLTEHLMFTGSENVKSFDEIMDKAGATNNAFTTVDYTNYYTVVPKCNVEVAMWAESDRMQNLTLTDESIETQRSVVIEEFKQRYFNKPYGDAPLILLGEHYKEHYYEWTPIGKSIKQLEDVAKETVREFWMRHYAPNNAVLVVAGNITLDETRRLVEKYYGDIEKREISCFKAREYEKKDGERRIKVKRNVPQDAVYMAFHSPCRGKEFYVSDLMSDMLCTGNSSRFFKNLLRGTNKFSQTNAYVEGYQDSDTFVVTAIPNEGVRHDEAEELLWQELEKIKSGTVSAYEIEKTVNRIELYRTHEGTSLTQVAQNLAKFENEGRLDEYEREMERYREIEVKDVERVASEVFRKENRTVVWMEREGK